MTQTQNEWALARDGRYIRIMELSERQSQIHRSLRFPSFHLRSDGDSNGKKCLNHEGKRSLIYCYSGYEFLSVKLSVAFCYLSRNVSQPGGRVDSEKKSLSIELNVPTISHN